MYAVARISCFIQHRTGVSMEKFYQYIDSALPDSGRNKLIYKFKRKTVNEMTERANQLTARGLKDDSVISDLIINENSNLAAKYREYAYKETKAEKRKKSLIGNIAGSIAYLLILIICFIGISMMTQQWDKTWVMVVDGILLWVVYILTISINRILETKQIFHIFARVLLAMEIVIISVIIFIFMLGILNTPHSWVTIFVGLFLMFLSDGLFASLTKQKLAIFSWLGYIPAMAAMLYIILGGLGILAWSIGWLIIPLSLFIDLLVVIITINKNTSYKEEVDDGWKES